MKLTLPLLGTIKTGKHAQEPSVQVVELPKSEGQEKIFDVLGGLLSFNSASLSSEKSVSHKILEANKEWVYRNNDVIAQEVSQIEFELFAVSLRSGEITFDAIDDHPLLDLLDKFNSRTTKNDGLYITQSHKKLTGDAFWLLDKNGGVVDNIFILQPDKIELELADPTDTTDDLITAYKYEDIIDGKEVKRTYAPEEIIHFKKPNPKNPFRGLGAVESISETIDTDNLTNEVQKNFFEKGAIGNFVLVTDANVTQDQLKRLKAEVQAAYGGAKNAFKAMIFGNGLKPMDIGFSNKDMDFLNLLEWYRDKIMIGFGNTKASIGIIDDVNRASYEGSHAGWLRGTVKPDMTSIVNTLNEFLVPMFGENLVLGYVDPIPQDVTDDTTEAVALKNAGIMTVNEAREKVGLDSIEGGDDFAPNNGTIADNTQEPNTPPTEPAPKKRVFKRTKQSGFKNLPDSLKHLPVKAILRKRGIYMQKNLNAKLKEAAIPIIRKQLQKKNTVPTAAVQKEQFTSEQITNYYAKQDMIVKAVEARFHTKVIEILDTVKNQAMGNLESEAKSIKGLKRFMAKKELFDQEQLTVKAQLDLTPLLIEEVILAGQEAYKLLGIQDTYIPYKVQDAIKKAVDKFATSMFGTDKEKLAKIIADGIAAGDSITEIRDAINADFSAYSKMQAERITRTEVLRAAAMATEDAFIQSGVVEAKQWLVAPNACVQCAPHSGQIVKLKTNFYAPDDSGFQDGNPPLHVNCRCVLIPLVMGVTSFKPNHEAQLEVMAERIKELEANFDKRTKDFKDLRTASKAKEEDDALYIKRLEKHLGLEDGN